MVWEMQEMNAMQTDDIEAPQLLDGITIKEDKNLIKSRDKAN